MNENEVLALLAENQNERGIANWKKLDSSGLESFGIGLTKLRKLAKGIGRDHDLAGALWRSKVYEAKVLGLLIDDPKQVTREQAEFQVEQLHGGMLAHVFSSCDATLAKTPFVRDLADSWMQSDDKIRRRCGYGLLYEISKDKKKSAPDDAYFLGWIDHIEESWQSEDTTTLCAMAGALMGIGKRNKVLNTAALRVAREIGPIHFDDKCDPMDVVKHLDNDRLHKKLGIS